MEKKVWIKIIGDHPHAGEYGFILSTDGKISYKYYPGDSDQAKFYEVTLLNCPHMTEGCFVEQKNVRIVGNPEQNDPPRGGSVRGRRT